MSGTQCVLCEPDRRLVVAESDSAIAVVSDEWAVDGHAVIIAKRHVEHVSELDDAARDDFFSLLARLESALLDTTAAARVVTVKLGFAVPHLHIHLYPLDEGMSRDDVIAIIERRFERRTPISGRDRFIERLRSVMT